MALSCHTGSFPVLQLRVPASHSPVLLRVLRHADRDMHSLNPLSCGPALSQAGMCVVPSHPAGEDMTQTPPVLHATRDTSGLNLLEFHARVCPKQAETPVGPGPLVPHVDGDMSPHLILCLVPKQTRTVVAQDSASHAGGREATHDRIPPCPSHREETCGPIPSTAALRAPFPARAPRRA